MKRTLVLTLLFLLLPVVPAWAADNDGDGLEDEWELSYFVALADEDGSGDPDGDGLSNLDEQSLGTDPTREDTDGDGLTDLEESQSPYALDPTSLDTDGDFLMDGEEMGLGTDPTSPDTDADGLTDYIEQVKGYNPVLGDSDNGGVWDGEEVLVDKTDPLDASDDLLDSDNDGITNFHEIQLGTNPFAADTDGDWLADGQEDSNHDGIWDADAGETDPVSADTDSDGLHDGWEKMVYKTDPFLPDTDGDGLTDGEEHALRITLYECLHPRFADSDQDGLLDGDETAADVASDPCLADTDGDGLLDISEVFDETDAADAGDAAPDADGDGLSDAYETEVTGTLPDDADTDGDGLTDPEEVLLLADGFLTDPLDADTDDDGLLDGSEGGILTEDGLQGGSDPTQWDTDGDDLPDGLEKGLAAPESSPKDPDATDPALFLPDSDPASTTNPSDSDSDDDGLSDGEEDANGDGAADGETDPNIFDTDGDGMDDWWETQYSTPEACGGAALGPLDPLDAGDKDLDNDADGLTNFKEYQLTKWQDNQQVKNQTNPCKVDSDGDGLSDKLEVSAKYNPGNPFQNASDPNNPDSDGDGIGDGVEDADHNGKWHPFNETNPMQKDTDGDNLDDGFEQDVVGTEPTVADTDGDGVSDGAEYNLFGTNPLDPDTDDDSLGDGLETGIVGYDDCPQTKTNPHLADTDGDGLGDGQEDADQDGCWEKADGETNPLDPDTDGDKLPDGLEVGAGNDADPATTTDPLVKDSDADGLWDSHEDKNKNGAVDEGETDPNDADTDDGGVADGTEVLVDATDPLDPLDDNTADPDGDGLTNGEEKAIGTNPYDADSDGDTISDTIEVGENHLEPHNHDGDEFIDALDTDSDGDSIPDSVEAGDSDLETDPVDSDLDETPDYLDLDSDDDTIPDAVEWTVDADNDGQPDPDADGDDLPNYLDPDSDNAQGPDAEEGVGDSDQDGIPNFVDPVEDEEEDLDADGDGLPNKQETEETGTDPFNPDTDSDGLDDKVEWEGPTDPLDADSDDDGLPDGDEGDGDADGDGLVQALDPDSDDDGVFDGTERGRTQPVEAASYESENGTTYEIAGTDLAAKNFQPDLHPASTTDHTAFDSDGDGAGDGAEDPNHNGKVDVGELDPRDPENGGASAAQIAEILADADGDGLTDRQEFGLGIAVIDGDLDEDGIADGAEHNWRCDTDRDGLPNFLDPDSDGDFRADGTEEGLLEPELAEWTELKYRNFIPALDPDAPTFALIPDPVPSGVDSDGDGLPDSLEETFGTDPLDADSDDDGLPDGAEPNWNFDTDRDGLAAALDPDADNDGLADGTEAGITDADPATTTLPALADTDDGGIRDGSEDTDKDGAVAENESDPNDKTDDSALCVDDDADGLCDAEEAAGGADPTNPDTDGDGLLDGDEHNWNFDTDGDGLNNVADPDSDDDGLGDGLELGVAGDADPNTTTFMLVADSDRGGLTDGEEDLDGNGRLDPLETDPLDPADDEGLPDDIDGDGLPNDVELELGTDPYDPDSDGDTIPDGVEVGEDVENPPDTDGDGDIDALDTDSDADTLGDAQEAGDDDLDTAPVDSDGDGTPDYRDLDSDDDGLGDEEEATFYFTDPTLPDTDGGGADDRLEVTVHGTDPNDPADDFRGWFEDGAGIGGGAGCSAGRAGAAGAALLLLLGLGGLLFFRRRRALPLVVALLVLPAAARAQYVPTYQTHPDAKVTALEANGYRLTPDGEGVLSLHGARLPIHAEFRSSAVFHYVNVPLAVVRDGEVLRELVSQRMELHLAAVAGLLGWLEVGVQAPVVLYQRARYPGLKLGDVGAAGFGNLAAFAKIQALSPDRFPVGLAVFLPVIAPTGDSEAYMGYDGWGFAPSVALTWQADPVLLAFNAGYHLQPHQSLLDVTDDDKITAGLGATWVINSDLEAALEVVGATRAAAPFSVAEELQAEVDAGVRYRLGDFRLTAGIGRGLTAAYMSPAVRAFAGIEYALRPNPDRDGDGIPNLRDACPDQAEDFDEFQDEDGCPDRDNDDDRILDADDSCPNEPEDFDGYRDEDGCPDPDNDNDGVLDADDQCPRQAEDLDKFQDEDGCPDPDNDSDGIPDVDDKCPDEKETFNDYQDEDGCPDKKLAEFQKEARRIQILEKVHFKFMSAELEPKSFEVLDQVVQILQENPQVRFVQVEGHTDKTGDAKFNLGLSRERAQAVVNYLAEHGIERKRLRARGFGDTRPLDYRTGPEANYINRRVEFNILKYDE